MTRLTAAAALVVITGVLAVQFLGGADAYAQVVQEIRNARTVVFTLITRSNQGNGETVKTDVAYKEPGHLRTTTIDGYIVLVDGISGKMLSIIPQGGYTLAELKGAAGTDSPSPLASIEAMKNLPAKAEENLGSREIDDIACDGYKVTQGDLTTAVWIDAKTGELVQIEHKYANSPGMNRIIKNIKFDVPLEDSLFALTSPAGFKPLGTELKDDGIGETEETFISWLRWWAGANVDETFPPMVAGTEIAKAIMDMGQQGKLRAEKWEKADQQFMFRAMLFVTRLPADGNWRYAGNGVKINTPDTPIFWYRPADGENYRVIYADLTVRVVTPDRLPK